MTSVRQAWTAWQGGIALADAAREAPELRAALDFFAR